MRFSMASFERSSFGRKGDLLRNAASVELTIRGKKSFVFVDDAERFVSPNCLCPTEPRSHQS